MSDTTRPAPDTIQDHVTDALLTYLISHGFSPASATRADVDDEFLDGVLAGLRDPGCPFDPESVDVLCNAIERRLVGAATAGDLASLTALNGALAKNDAPSSAPVDIEGTFNAIAKAISPNHPQSIEFGVSASQSGSDWRLSVRTGPRESSDAVGHGGSFVSALLDLARAAAKASRKNANVLAERAEAQRDATRALEAIAGDR